MKDFLKNYYERNKPVFTIGLATLVIFLLVIIVYRIMPRKSTSMSRIGNESSFNVTSEEANNAVDESQQISESTGADVGITPEQSIDQTFGILDIAYTEKGFTPKLARVVQGQVVKWTNKTDKIIFLKQKTPTYSELKDLVQIDPGQTFSFRVSKSGTWNYEEDISKYFAILEVYTFRP